MTYATETFIIIPAAIADDIGALTLYEIAHVTGQALLVGPGSKAHTDRVYREFPGDDLTINRERLQHKAASYRTQGHSLRADSQALISEALRGPLNRPTSAPVKDGDDPVHIAESAGWVVEQDPNEEDVWTAWTAHPYSFGDWQDGNSMPLGAVYRWRSDTGTVMAGLWVNMAGSFDGPIQCQVATLTKSADE